MDTEERTAGDGELPVLTYSKVERIEDFLYQALFTARCARMRMARLPANSRGDEYAIESATWARALDTAKAHYADLRNLHYHVSTLIADMMAAEGLQA